MWTKRSFSQSKIIDLTNDVVEEIGIEEQVDIACENTTTVRKKIPKSLLSPIHEFDFHRPEFQRITKPEKRRYHSSSFANAHLHDKIMQVNEVDVSPTS